VIGVMPGAVRFPRRETEVWQQPAAETPPTRNTGRGFNRAVARLKPGVTMEQAQAEVNTSVADDAAEPVLKTSAWRCRCLACARAYWEPR